jgi:hypothetical protein
MNNSETLFPPVCSQQGGNELTEDFPFPLFSAASPAA